MIWVLALVLLGAGPQEEPRVREAMKKATTFFRSVSQHGGYLWFYSADLKERWGEGRATADQVWVQPPGTPEVGSAFLKAYGATKDAVHLEAARDAAKALQYGQLRSGGWTHAIDFDPKGKLRAAYRSGGGGRNYSTLDDGTTQAAIRFLAELDRALEFKDAAVHESAMIALEALLKAQFANGGFPQVWEGAVAARPVLPARYPETWSRTPTKETKEYWNFYTLNDSLPRTVVETLLEAHRIYKEKAYLDAAKKHGDFLILAQMPDPQPAWAQQYDFEMHPTWARKFEPPAITSWESQDAMEALLLIYRATGDEKYLAPLPRALAYLRTCLLPDGQFARFYELKTNRPLYMTTKYELTYEDSDLPTHYGFKQASRLDRIEKDFQAAKAKAPPPGALVSRADVQRVLEALDAEGRWLEEGEPRRGLPKGRYLLSRTFSRNLTLLAESLAR